MKEAGGHVVRVAGDARVPDLKVLFLEDGEIGFFGTAEEFAETRIPSVAYMDTSSERRAFSRA